MEEQQAACRREEVAEFWGQTVGHDTSLIKGDLQAEVALVDTVISRPLKSGLQMCLEERDDTGTTQMYNLLPRGVTLAVPYGHPNLFPYLG